MKTTELTESAAVAAVQPRSYAPPCPQCYGTGHIPCPACSDTTSADLACREALRALVHDIDNGIVPHMHQARKALADCKQTTSAALAAARPLLAQIEQIADIPNHGSWRVMPTSNTRQSLLVLPDPGCHTPKASLQMDTQLAKVLAHSANVLPDCVVALRAVAAALAKAANV